MMYDLRHTLISLLLSAFALLAVSSASGQTFPPAPPLWEDEVATVLPAGTGVKWYPGHYIKGQEGTSISGVTSLLREQNVEGITMEYDWADLEPTRNNYDFSRIERDLAEVKALGKRLIIIFEDRDFRLDSPRGVLPDYVIDDPALGVSPTKNGYIANYWKPAVMDREIALVRALGARFDADPFIAGIGNGESSPGFAGNIPASYDDGDALIQFTRLYNAMASAFPTTVRFQQANFWTGKEGSIEQLLESLYQQGCGMAEPDSVRRGGVGTETNAMQAYRINYLGKMPRLGIVSAQSNESGATYAEMMDYFAVAKYHFVAWIPSRLKEAIATIDARNGAINTTCPDNLAICNSAN